MIWKPFLSQTHWFRNSKQKNNPGSSSVTINNKCWENQAMFLLERKWWCDVLYLQGLSRRQQVNTRVFGRKPKKKRGQNGSRRWWTGSTTRATAIDQVKTSTAAKPSPLLHCYHGGHPPKLLVPTLCYSIKCIQTEEIYFLELMILCTKWVSRGM